MAKLFNLARMTTATTGTGTITLGSAVAGFLSFAGAGVANADVVAYGIQDGANSEVGTGTYTSSGTTLTRTVLASTNAGSAISLSGSAQVFITALKEQIGNLGEVNTWTAIQNFSAVPRPTSNDGVALGDTTHGFSDLFLASGAVINWNNGELTLTQSSAFLLLTASSTQVGLQLTATDNGATGPSLVFFHDSASPAASDQVATIQFSGRDSAANSQVYGSLSATVTVATSGSETSQIGIQCIASGTLKTAYLYGSVSAFAPGSDDLFSLGASGVSWSDLWLASGAVINWAASDVTLTHSSDKLTIAGGNLTLAAGTTSIAPLTYQSGSNLTTPADGATEYDGVAFYRTVPGTKRGIAPTEHFLSLSANQSGSNSSTAQTWFPGGGSTSLNVAASTTYEFEGFIGVARTAGTTAHNIFNLFGGTATITSIAYVFTAVQSLGGGFDIGNGQMFFAQSTSALSIVPNTSSANEHVLMRVNGIVRVNAAGTFIPQFKYDTAPGGTPTVQANTYFRMWAIGSSSVLNVGNWS